MTPPPAKFSKEGAKSTKIEEGGLTAKNAKVTKIFALSAFSVVNSFY